MKRLVGVILLFTAVSVFAQEKLPRKLYVEFAEKNGVGGSGETIRYFTEVVISEYTDIIIVENEEESDCTLQIAIKENESTSEDDEDAEMDAPNRLIISVTAYDSYFKEEKFDYEYPSEGYSIISMQEEFFPELVSRTAEAFPPRDPEIEEVFTERIVENVEVKRVLKGIALTIRGVPGTLITSKTGEVYRLDDTGEVLLELPFDTTFSFRAEHPDYFPQNETVLVERQNMEYEIEQTKSVRWGFDAGIRIWAIGLEAAAVFYPIPNRLFLTLHLESSLISVIYLTGGQSLFLTPSLNVGFYLLPPDSFVRFAISAGLFTRFVFPPGEPAYLSRLVTFGAQIPLRIELSPFKRVRFFAEYKPRLIYMSGDKNFYSRFSGLEMLSITDQLYVNLGWNFVVGTRVSF